MLSNEDLKRLDFEKGNGLMPAVIQNAVSGRVLMLGYMNREAWIKLSIREESHFGRGLKIVCGQKVRQAEISWILLTLLLIVTVIHC